MYTEIPILIYFDEVRITLFVSKKNPFYKSYVMPFPHGLKALCPKQFYHSVSAQLALIAQCYKQ